jgi:hypothetical protein
MANHNKYFNPLPVNASKWHMGFNTFRLHGVYILCGLSSHQSSALQKFIQQISILKILNMLHNLRFSLFKMPFIS